jgi:hypothetical protein
MLINHLQVHLAVIESQMFAAVFVPRVSLVSSNGFHGGVHYMQDTIQEPIEDSQVVEPVQLQ